MDAVQYNGYRDATMRKLTPFSRPRFHTNEPTRCRSDVARMQAAGRNPGIPASRRMLSPDSATLDPGYIWAIGEYGNRGLSPVFPVPGFSAAATLFVLIAQIRVADRPGRIEPRAVKRRPKPFPRLDRPRQQARMKIEKYGHAKKLRA